VRKVVALSTDKASSPINLYGATKLVSDNVLQSANHYAGTRDSRFSVVRYSNVLGSRGSVVPFFKKLAREGKDLPITDPTMTRFWVTPDQAVDFIVSSLEMMRGGEVFVPKIPSIKILDFAKAISSDSATVASAIRPGKKLHEEMISLDDSRRTIELTDRCVILPTINNWGISALEGKSLPEGFSYRSDTKTEWLSIDQLRQLV